MDLIYHSNLITIFPNRDWQRGWIAKSLKLLATGWTTLIQFGDRDMDFSFRHRVPSESVKQSNSRPVGTEGSFSWLKRPDNEAHYPPETCGEIKNAHIFAFNLTYTKIEVLLGVQPQTLKPTNKAV
jgi:hypothetical protein